MVYVALLALRRQVTGQFRMRAGAMGTKIARTALLIGAMTFFAVLALDIAVPATVLSVMVLSTWLVLHERPTSQRHGEAAA
jgi:hypothetical protein